MEEEEFESFFKKEMFSRIDEMIEENKLTIENAILLMKHIGYCKTMKFLFLHSFEENSFRVRLEKMIIEENEKKDEKNEKLLVDLCECYLLLNDEFILYDFLSMIMPPLLKVASKKEESEETKKEVEMALLALSCIRKYREIEQELYLNEIKEIIKYHQEHRTMTRLAYQSAWMFLIDRLDTDKSLERVIVNELHFAREATRELEELTICIDWKRGKETKEEVILFGWLRTLQSFFFLFQLRNEEFIWLFSSIVQVFRAAKDNCRGIRSQCICSLRRAAKNRNVKIDDWMKSGAIDAILEEIQRPTLNDDVAYECLLFFTNVSNRLKEKTKNKMNERKRKATKMETFEKLEEEGYEDIITSFHETLNFLNRKYNYELSLDISDYFMNV
ncbi:uncharacterized protein MONOS_18625 [Monocercomonoides exilis]|uniref:uncharacterized protein n=1 Tax=Monocercomonoides exilis TaxID=2049356 RepID=UPI00355AB69A|nr:hypothetical protein MONOS_18625 [Monocercomonoides exilis]